MKRETFSEFGENVRCSWQKTEYIQYYGCKTQYWQFSESQSSSKYWRWKIQENKEIVLWVPISIC